jgi:hypothetical protein
MIKSLTPKQKIMKKSNLFGKVLFLWVTMFSQAGFAQNSGGPAAAPQSDPNEKAIKAYYTAYEKKDWNLMEEILADGFTFTSPLDDHINLKAYKERCWPNAYKTKRFDVEKLVINGEDAFVTYNGWTNDGKLFRNTEYFKIKVGKIMSNECFFGSGVNFPNSGK